MPAYPFFNIGDTLIIEYEDNSGRPSERQITIHDLEISRKDVRINAYCHMRRGARQFLGRRITLAYTLDGEIIPHKAVFQNMIKNPADYLTPPPHDAAGFSNKPPETRQTQPHIFWRFLFTIWTIVYFIWVSVFGLGYLVIAMNDGPTTFINITLAVAIGIPTALHLSFRSLRGK